MYAKREDDYRESPKLQWESVCYSHDGVPSLIEIIPTNGHVESTSCPCEPWLAQSCSECDGESDCWRCGGRGLVGYDEWSGKVPWVVHHDERLP